MKDFQLLERFAWFHQQVRNKHFPNEDTLAARFGLSARIARRDIEYIRNHLGAPLEYDQQRNGYYYADSGFEIGRVHASQEELLAILLARNILTDSAGGLISHAINSFGRKLFAATANMGLTEKRVQEAFSATWYGYAPAPPDVFRDVSGALLQYRILQISYTSPISGEFTERQVEPHHLQLYMGSWILLAWCRLRQAWRKFYLARMRNVKVLEHTFSPRPKQEWQQHLEGGFGIFQGEEHVQVVLRFTPVRSRWIREQIWHPQQELRELGNGGVELRLPVADFREIKLRILQFGGDVEVLEPTALREEIVREIEQMAIIYKTDASRTAIESNSCTKVGS